MYVVTRICDEPTHRFVSSFAGAADTHLPKETAGLRRQCEDLRILVRSHVGCIPAEAVFSHRSALIIHGLPIPFFDRGEVPVAEAVHPTLGVRRSQLTIRKREFGGDDVVSADGAPVTSLVRTLFDVARDFPPAFAVPVADAAVRRSLISVQELKRYCSDHPVRTHGQRIESALGMIDPRRESIAESIAAVRFVEYSVPGLDPQVIIHDESGNFVARTDFANEQAQVVAEFDGAGKYYLEHTDPKRAFELERRREYQLRNLGYIVFRMTWQDLFRADLFLRIKAAIAKRVPITG